MNSTRSDEISYSCLGVAVQNLFAHPTTSALIIPRSFLLRDLFHQTSNPYLQTPHLPWYQSSQNIPSLLIDLGPENDQLRCQTGDQTRHAPHVKTQAISTSAVIIAQQPPPTTPDSSPPPSSPALESALRSGPSRSPDYRYPSDPHHHPSYPPSSRPSPP